MEEAIERISERFATILEQKLLEKLDELFQEWPKRLLEGEIPEEKLFLEEEIDDAQESFVSEKDWRNYGLLELQTEQIEGKSPEVLLQLKGNLSDLETQIGKIYNIDFWIFRQNQLPTITAVHFMKKFQNGSVQIEAGSLSLPGTRGKLEFTIVKKGMG